MSGHSKWSTIKHQKAATDQKRGKIFSKISRMITITVKEGHSGDPDSNPRLRLAIDQARSVNMPKENIKRAIERGLGKGEGSNLETVVYEGFGPAKVAVMVECVTDNKNRMAAEIKSFFEKEGGAIGNPGSTAYLFNKQGLIIIEKKGRLEDQILQLIDFGAQDVEEAGELIEVYTKPEKLMEIKEKAIQAGFIIKEASIYLKPVTSASVVEEKTKEKVLNFLEKLDDIEDVQKVYCNVDFH